MKLRRGSLLAVWVALLLLGVFLFLWSLRAVSFSDIVSVFSALSPWQILLLLLVNIAILLLFPLRWWLILRAQGHRVPYLALTRYRLTAFAVSYFTPGQHFGGEPLQVLFLRDRHKVKGSTALASVTLDKVIELFANFSVLALGIAVVLTSGVVGELPVAQTLPASIGLLLVPAAYLFSVYWGWLPFTRLTKNRSSGFVTGLQNAEKQLAQLTQKKPGLLLQGLGIAILVWISLIFEIWLSLVFLGLTLNAVELALVVVAGRIALFAPTPGALGALEASQVLAMHALGYDPAYGLALGLLIRARDIFFGLVGLLLGALSQS